ncbi:hypothetical protein [sulfur-oxidizing endosymbiont of Gigantopelta aegis]|uniref:hypothetical protein n=1 Tax=sulfur-oxidizing endosymbiont of Gigantopelta aegis TaxID=2794934 RepID=UPI0018DE0E3A|nr:hypothetical protein [sulfur-oxidizing endosymbiont of Gigantopelta aegis]
MGFNGFVITFNDININVFQRVDLVIIRLKLFSSLLASASPAAKTALLKVKSDVIKSALINNRKVFLVIESPHYQLLHRGLKRLGVYKSSIISCSSADISKQRYS